MKKLFLLIAGCIVAHGSVNAYGPLIREINSGYPPYVQEVLKLPNVDVNETDEHGKTALHYAVNAQGEIGLEIVRMLLHAGADVNRPDDNGKTALRYAVMVKGESALEIVRMLLHAGADVNRHDDTGVTPLCAARFLHSNPEAAQLIQDHIDRQAAAREEAAALAGALLSRAGAESPARTLTPADIKYIKELLQKE